MKDFFIQCLKELEAKTGIRQLFFLESREDGGSQVELLIDTMVAVCREYTYIPEAAKQKIVLKMMVEDQQYDGLNARTLRKWFDRYRDYYWSAAHQVAAPKDDPPPAAPEVVEKYMRQFRELAEKIGDPSYQAGLKKMRDEAGLKSVAQGHPSTDKEKVAAVYSDLMKFREQTYRDRHPGCADSDVDRFLESVSGRL